MKLNVFRGNTKGKIYVEVKFSKTMMSKSFTANIIKKPKKKLVLFKMILLHFF